MVYDEWAQFREYTVNDYVSSGYVCAVALSFVTGMNSDFSDIRIADSEGNELDYFIGTYVASTSAYIFFKTGNTATVRIYYGNSSATSESNGANVFTFFDHFDRASLDSDWVAYGSSGSVALSNSECVITGGDKHIRAATARANNYTLVARMKTNRWNTTNGLQQFGFNYLGGSDTNETRYIQMNFAHIAAGNPRSVCHATGSNFTSSLAATGDWSTNTYYIAELKRAGTHTRFTVNGTNKITLGTSYYPTEDLYPYFRAYNSGDTVTVDWVGIRPYVATDPTLTYTGTGSNRSCSHSVGKVNLVGHIGYRYNRSTSLSVANVEIEEYLVVSVVRKPDKTAILSNVTLSSGTTPDSSVISTSDFIGMCLQIMRTGTWDWTTGVNVNLAIYASQSDDFESVADTTTPFQLIPIGDLSVSGNCYDVDHTPKYLMIRLESEGTGSIAGITVYYQPQVVT